MPAKRPLDLAEVKSRFEAWRARVPKQPFPDDLWLAAASLLDRHHAHTICQTLRLNEARFKQMREQLGVLAVTPAGRRGAVTREATGGDGGATVAQPSGRSAPKQRAKGTGKAARRRGGVARPASAPLFVEVGTLDSGWIGQPRTVAEPASRGCRLSIETPAGVRFHFELLAADPPTLAAICAAILERHAGRNGRPRR